MPMRLRGGFCAAALFASLACGGGGGSGEGGSSSSQAQSFSVSGEIQIAYASAIDGDVNDPAAPYKPNDTPATAQAIPNPVTLGGYANVALQGAAGRSFSFGDPFDYYSVSLAAGQTVRLFMSGDGTTNDLDLALIDSNGTQVAFSDTNTPAEAVTAPASGQYLIEVSAFAGAANYVLSIGQATNPLGTAAAASAAAIPTTAEEWVPGELVVRYGERMAGKTARRASDAAAADATELGLVRVAGAEHGPQLLAGRDPDQLDRALERVGKAHLSESARVRRGAPAAQDPKERNAALSRDTRRLAKALRQRGGVLSADPNFVRRAAAVPTDQYYPLQWHYPLVRLPEAWDLVTPSSGIVVAVVDTGVLTGHPDLQGQLAPGYDFILDPTSSLDGDGCDADPNDPGDQSLPHGKSSFHGTHVAGTVAARTSLEPGGTSEGVAGVAWNARVMPLRALGKNGGTDFDVIQAIRYAAGLSNGCGVLPAAPADVINMSLGGAGDSAALDAAIMEARNAGLVIVAAAGNEASSQPSFPAASPGVISVSAVDADAKLAPYSNFGSTIDVAAPGGDMSVDHTFDGYGDGVFSTLYDEDRHAYAYGFYQGTSMAAPHVSGIIALMLGVNPALTPADIDTLLTTGFMTRNIGSSNFYGHGLIDAFVSVSSAIQAKGGTLPTLPPQLLASPGALNFGAQSTQATVTLSNGGGPTPPLSVSSAEAITDDGGSWLSVQSGSVAASGLGTYTVSVTRTGLADGIYTGAARFHSSAGDLDVPVIVQVGTATTTNANAGHEYVLLVAPDTLATVAAVEVDSKNGHYKYSFAGVAPGTYLIYAGTDDDNDNFLCDSGEACGSYPTLNQPLTIVVDGNMQDLDFLTGFGLRIGASSTQASDGGISRVPAAPAPTSP
jgi:serine protease